MLTDKPEKVKGGKIKVSLRSGDQELVLGTWNYQEMEPDTNQEGPEFSGVLPDFLAGTFTLKIEVENAPELNSEYVLLMAPVTR